MSFFYIGSIYVHDCRAERFIPIYLIVMGCFGVIKNLSGLGQRAKASADGEENEEGGGNKKRSVFDHLISTFMFAWFIAGMRASFN